VPLRFLPARLDGRWIAAGIVAVFGCVLKLTALAVGRPIFELPPFSWFGPMPPYFADLRGVVSWSDQYAAAGRTASGPLLDPWNRPMNYPHPWLYLHDLGVNGGNVMMAGYAIGALFIAAAFFVLGPLDVFGGVVAGGFLTSYAVLFGFERANVDLLLFALLAGALAGRRFPAVAAFLTALAAILKVHPLFAFGAMVRPPWKQSLSWLGAGVLLFIVVTSLHAREFMVSLGSAPNMRTGRLSFGMTALGLELAERARRLDLYPLVLATGVAALILVAGAAVYVRPSLSLARDDERALFAFRIGAGIYLGSYLLGTNHDYRAACLVFCLPLLLRLLRQDASRRWAFGSLLLVLVSVDWLYLAGDGEWLDSTLKQGTSWALFFCLSALFAATLLQDSRLGRAGRPGVKSVLRADFR